MIAIGDLHLDKQRIRGLFGADANALQLEPVEEALELAVDHGVPRVVLLGDVFDRPRPTVAGLMSLLQVLFDFDRGLEMHVILGNHDVESANKPHSMSLVKGLCDRGLLTTTFVHEEVADLDWDGTPVRMCPWGHSDPGPAKLCFGHFARAGSVRDNGHAVGEDDKDVAEEMGDAIWVSGHLHTAQKIGGTFFPGTTAQYSFGEEDGHKHVLRVHTAKQGKRLKAESWRIKRPYRLATEVIEDEAGWLRKLPNKRRVKYRVLHDPELRQPDHYLRDNPAVVECRPSGTKSRSIGSDLAQEMAAASGGGLEYGMTDGLADLLKSWGLDKQQVARAHEIVGEGIESLGLG